MAKNKILITGNSKTECRKIEELTTHIGYDAEVFFDKEQLLESLTNNTYHAIIADLNVTGPTGLLLLEALTALRQECPIIAIGNTSSINVAVTAIKLGAFDYIAKPYTMDDIKQALEKAGTPIHTTSQYHPAMNYKDWRFIDENNPIDAFDPGEFIGQSDAMRKVYETIKKVSNSDSTVIIYGESGTGKELVAKAIHYNSDRRHNKIVAVNCGAIPEDLLESELFGHEKGAFTGAIRSRIGRFELAQGGTIFLDEIGDMSPSLQVKLLRVIQEKVFERIGGINTIKSDVRIISATNQDLEKKVAEKKFREDLFYRINVIPIHLPPLRTRKVDIPVLANHFLRQFNSLNRKNITKITDEAMKILLGYPWPGNVRELQNVIERTVVMKESGAITVADLPERIVASAGSKKPVLQDAEVSEDGIDLNKTLEELEKKLLSDALRRSRGVKSEAARLLKINRTTLVEKLKRFQMTGI